MDHRRSLRPCVSLTGIKQSPEQLLESSEPCVAAGGSGTGAERGPCPRGLPRLSHVMSRQWGYVLPWPGRGREGSSTAWLVGAGTWCCCSKFLCGWGLLPSPLPGAPGASHSSWAMPNPSLHVYTIHTKTQILYRWNTEMQRIGPRGLLYILAMLCTMP